MPLKKRFQKPLPAKTLMQKTDAWIKSQSFPVPEKPTFGQDSTIVPADLTKLNGAQLNNLMNRITLMSDYLGYELAKAEVSHLEAETKYDFHNAKLYLSTTASNKKYAVVAHPESAMLKELLDQRFARVKLMTALVDGQDKRYKALSRELTRRQMDWDKRNHHG